MLRKLRKLPYKNSSQGAVLHEGGADLAPPRPTLSFTKQALTGRSWKPVRYAAVGGPNQVVSASASPTWVRSPTQATYPSGRTKTAVGAVIAPIPGSSHVPTTYLASIN